MKLELYCSLSVVFLVSLTPRILAAQEIGIGAGAGTMWGTAGGAVGKSTLQSSADMNAANGTVAGQVNAARNGYLYSGITINVSSIGSQSVVNTTIVGSGNSANVSASQSSSNSGSVSNNGSLAMSGNPAGGVIK